MKLIIYTDGASRGNPGRAAYGFVIYDSDRKILHKQGGFLGIKTNNFAEYTAVIKAIEYIKANFPLENLTLNFFADSKLVVQQLTGNYRVKSESIRPLYEKILSELHRFVEASFKYVPREANKLADAMANLALDSC